MLNTNIATLENSYIATYRAAWTICLKWASSCFFHPTNSTSQPRYIAYSLNWRDFNQWSTSSGIFWVFSWSFASRIHEPKECGIKDSKKLIMLHIVVGQSLHLFLDRLIVALFKRFIISRASFISSLVNELCTYSTT